MPHVPKLHCQPPAGPCNAASLTAHRCARQSLGVAPRWRAVLELPLNERTEAFVTLLSRIFGRQDDDREALRPLWTSVVALAREPAWYAQCGVADTVTGRFDMLTLVLATVMLRMEREEALIAASARLSELFVADMDGQMRQSGVGDLVVGKRMGKLMGALGGRLGVLREALKVENGVQDDAALVEVARRNATLTEAGDPGQVGARLRALAVRLDATSAEELLAGRITP